jgi:arylsulfatase A-like enzyme
MKTYNGYLIWLTVLALVICGSFSSRAQDVSDDRPNIVLIFTDNHSAWTLGAYGNEEIRTPNIDRLADEGMRFTSAYTVNPVCSPNRATLLTGLIPSQHGVHSFLASGTGIQMGPDAYNTIEEFRSLPEILADAGYINGLSGKWHLGNSIEPQEQFSYWYTFEHGGVPFYDADVIWNGEVQNEPRYMTTAITDHATDFIEQNYEKEDPFFLFVAYNGPYGLGNEFRKTHENRHTSYYADKKLLSFPREPIHPWQYNHRDFFENMTTIRGYAAAVSGIDDGVGRLMETLDQYDLDENTLVIFTSDQGLAGGHHGIWGMGDHTRPSAAFDEMLRIPLIYRYPGHIQAGMTSDKMVSIYDFYPTLLSYLGLEEEIPGDPARPGRDYTPVLQGGDVGWDDVIFYEFENTRLIRTRDWKYTYRYPEGPHDLYDMKNTPGERINFIHNAAYSEVQARLHERMETFFDTYAAPEYDMWKGGTSKVRVHMME